MQEFTLIGIVVTIGIAVVAGLILEVIKRKKATRKKKVSVSTTTVTVKTVVVETGIDIEKE